MVDDDIEGKNDVDGAGPGPGSIKCQITYLERLKQGTGTAQSPIQDWLSYLLSCSSRTSSK